MGHKESMKKYMDKKRARGLCTNCTRQVVAGMSRCDTHLERARAYSKSVYAGIKAKLAELEAIKARASQAE